MKGARGDHARAFARKLGNAETLPDTTFGMHGPEHNVNAKGNPNNKLGAPTKHEEQAVIHRLERS